MYNSTWIKELYDPEKEFTLFDIVGAAYQVAKGMEFLASRKVIPYSYMLCWHTVLTNNSVAF